MDGGQAVLQICVCVYTIYSNYIQTKRPSVSGQMLTLNIPF